MTAYDWFKKHSDKLEKAVSEWPEWLKEAERRSNKRPALSAARRLKKRKDN